MSITFEMDPFADAVYVRVECERVASTVELDPQRSPAHPELQRTRRNCRDGVPGRTRSVDLSNLPHRDELARYFSEHQIRIVA
jgi:hypothetical protein